MAEKAIWLDIAVGLFLAFDCASTHTDPFNSEKTYHKSVKLMPSSITKAYSLFQQQLRVHWAHVAVATQRMPWDRGLNTDYQIWENIGLWGILWARMRGIYFIPMLGFDCFCCMWKREGKGFAHWKQSKTGWWVALGMRLQQLHQHWFLCWYTYNTAAIHWAIPFNKDTPP